MPKLFVLSLALTGTLLDAAPAGGTRQPPAAAVEFIDTASRE